MARFDRDAFALSVAVLDPPATLAEWCAAAGAEHAIVGGFYMRPGGPPLGDVWVGGEALPSEPFDSPWHRCRACVHVDAGNARLLAREEIEGAPRGDLLQAGPMLVREGEVAVHTGVDAEGFSAGSRQFDSDISAGRYPRAALGLAGTRPGRGRLRRPRRRRRGDDDEGARRDDGGARLRGRDEPRRRRLGLAGRRRQAVTCEEHRRARPEPRRSLRGGRGAASASGLSPQPSIAGVSAARRLDATTPGT